MTSLEFARPYWLPAGVAACSLVLWGMFAVDRWRRAALAKLVHPRFHARLMPAVSPGLRWTKRGLWLAAIMLLCTAAAGPQTGYEWREVKRRGIDLLFAVDTSRSMLAEDLSPNRLERARMGILDFVERLNGDRVGLVPFAGSAYPLCPLTVDYDAFKESLDALDTEIIPKAGTDVAAAIRESQKLLETQGSNHRILVLITDGEDFQGDVEAALKEAKEKGLTIHTIGVGSTEGVRIPMKYPNGQMDYVRDDSGQPVLTKLDEDTLRSVAEKTGGLYAPLGRRAEGLDMIYNEKLRLVPKNEMESKHEKIPLLRYEWPLSAALICLLMNFLLPDRRREAKPRILPSAGRRVKMEGAADGERGRRTAPGASITLTAVIALAFSAGEIRAEEDARVLFNKGTEAYDAGDFSKAETTLRSALKTPDLTLQNRAYYNLGNTLYRLGQAAQEKDLKKTHWEESLKAYDAALALNSSDADARYNRDLVQRKLDELNKPEEKKDDEKKDDQQKQEKQNEQKDQQQKEGDDKKEDGGQKENPGQEQQGGDSKKQKDQSEKRDGQNQSGGEQEKKDPGKEGEQKQQGDGEPKNQKDSPSSAGEKKDEQKEGGEQPQPGEQKEGEKKDGPAQEPKPGEGQEGEEKEAGKEGEAQGAEKKPAGEAKSTAEERRNPNEMSEAEARRLLQALRREERTVIPIDRPPPQRRGRDLNNTTKGKSW